MSDTEANVKQSKNIFKVVNENEFKEIHRNKINDNIEFSIWKYNNGDLYVDIRQHRFKKPTRKGVRLPLSDFKSFLNNCNISDF
jgi:hypothetical protein